MVTIHADLLNKRSLTCILCAAFFLIIFLYIAIAFLLPNVFVSPVSLENCPLYSNDFQGFCNKIDTTQTYMWSSYLYHMNVTNNFFIINGQAERHQNFSSEELNVELKFVSRIYPLDIYGNSILIEKKPEKSAAPSLLVAPEARSEFDNFKELSITTESLIEISCQKGKTICEQNILIFYPEINHSNYKIEVWLRTNEISVQFETFSFSSVTANSRYTMFLLLLRYTLFILSVLFGSRYMKFYWALNPFIKTFEHRAIFVLSVLLILFNDPFYAATILKANIFFAVLSSFFVCAFLTVLIMFWIVMIRRIHLEPATPESKVHRQKRMYIPTIIIFSLLFGSSSVASVVSKLDPSFHMNSEFPRVYYFLKVFVLIFGIFLIAAFVYNSYKIVRSWSLIINRHKFFFLLSLYFIIALFFLAITGLYQSYDTNGIKVLLVFVMYNFYIFVLQSMWKVTPKGMKEAKAIFQLEKGIDLGFEHEKAENRELGFEYFENSIDVEVTRDNPSTEMKETESSLKKSEIRKNRRAILQEKVNEEQAIEIPTDEEDQPVSDQESQPDKDTDKPDPKQDDELQAI